jgi:hypothetical protein
VTPDRAREIAARDHGGHCRQCAESIDLARAYLAASERADAAEERLRVLAGCVRAEREARVADVLAAQAFADERAHALRVGWPADGWAVQLVMKRRAAVAVACADACAATDAALAAAGVR